MTPATVKKLYGLILPNRLLNPMAISHMETNRFITVGSTNGIIWCFMWVSDTFVFLRITSSTTKAAMAKNKGVSGFMYFGANVTNTKSY